MGLAFWASRFFSLKSMITFDGNCILLASRSALPRYFSYTTIIVIPVNQIMTTGGTTLFLLPRLSRDHCPSHKPNSLILASPTHDSSSYIFSACIFTPLSTLRRSTSQENPFQLHRNIQTRTLEKKDEAKSPQAKRVWLTWKSVRLRNHS